MKIDVTTTGIAEVFVDTDTDFNITVYPWGNLEGVSVMMHDKNLTNRGSFSLQWNELEALTVALATARAA
jgi:hypothetical protein